MPAMGMVGNYVRERRRELGLTLGEVATLTGVSHQAISQIELGQTRELKGSTAVRLARALEVPLEELLDKIESIPA